MKNDLGNKKIFSRNLIRFMNMYGFDRQGLCDALDYKYTTVSDWINAKKYPRIDKIEELADLFKCTKADLVEDPAHRNFLPLSSEEKNILAHYRACSIPAKGRIENAVSEIFMSDKGLYEDEW